MTNANIIYVVSLNQNIFNVGSKFRFAKLLSLLCVKIGKPPARVPLFPLLRRLNSPLLRLSKRKGISSVATDDKGSSPLTSPPFEKGGRKLSTLGAVRTPRARQKTFLRGAVRTLKS